jgi:hypothetical protein
MQSSETKAKRKQKPTKETGASEVQSPISTQEETPKLKRRTTATKVTAEPKPAAKHRAAVRKPAAPETVTATAPATSTIAARATHEEIAVLAYSYWENRGHQDGTPEEDWLRAERELRSR